MKESRKLLEKAIDKLRKSLNIHAVVLFGLGLGVTGFPGATTTYSL